MDFYPQTLAMAGAAALLTAIVARLGDRRRMRRSDPDAVGFMPWTAVFFWALLAGVIVLVAAVRLWLAK